MARVAYSTRQLICKTVSLLLLLLFLLFFNCKAWEKLNLIVGVKSFFVFCFPLLFFCFLFGCFVDDYSQLCVPGSCYILLFYFCCFLCFVFFSSLLFNFVKVDLIIIDVVITWNFLRVVDYQENIDRRAIKREREGERERKSQSF